MTTTEKRALAPAADAAPAPYTGFDRMPLAGRWRAGRAGEIRQDVDPYTDEVLTEIPLADAADVDLAYRGAQRAQREWAALLPTERAEVMRRAAAVMDRRRPEIARWLTHEAGAASARVDLELTLTRAITLAAAGHAHAGGRLVPSDTPGKENRVHRRPVGVVGVISPWNFPLFLANRSVAPALAVGNAVVLKPASDTPVTGGLLLAKIYEEAGLPPGLLSVVVGRGSEVGDPVVQHPVPRVLSFTGSTAVGEGIAAKAGLKRLVLELGGNGPLVVLDDADLDAAATAAVHGSFYHQGQVCMATNRVIVDDAVHDAFVDAFLARARALRVGDPRDPATQIGPLINDRQLASVQDKVSRAVADGAESVLGGPPGGPTGRVLPPQVLLGDNRVATAAEEVFGPVATLIRADGEEDALRIANDTPYGLSSAVFSRDVERGVAFARRLEAGMTHVNDTTVHDDVHAAFGGEKASGLGRFGGDWVVEEFTTHHWVSVQRTPRSLNF